MLLTKATPHTHSSILVGIDIHLKALPELGCKRLFFFLLKCPQLSFLKKLTGNSVKTDQEVSNA